MLDSLFGNPLFWLAIAIVVIRLLSTPLSKRKRLGRPFRRIAKIKWRSVLVTAAVVLAIAVVIAFQNAQTIPWVNPTY